MYATTDMVYAEVAEACNISLSAMQKRACINQENWQRMRAEQRLRKVRTQKFDAFVAQVESGEAQPKTRGRYAKYARDLSKMAYEKLHQLHAEGELTAGTFARLVTSLRRLQEIEFTALGIASDISAVQSTHTLSWSDFLRQVREERGLEDEDDPFEKPSAERLKLVK